jgi:hypothetical protein
MSEHIAAEIWIGGKVPLALVPNLCEAIRREGVALDWGDAVFQPRSAEDLLDARKDYDQGITLLWLCDDRASWGQFEALESFLQRNGISFRRRSEGTSEYAPEVVEHRNGVGLISLATTATGEPVVAAAELAPIATALSDATGALRSDRAKDAIAVLETAQESLRAMLPPVLPPLESFEIIPARDPPEQSLREAQSPVYDSDSIHKAESVSGPDADADSQVVRRWVLYDLDADCLITTRVYDAYETAVDDAQSLTDVLVLPLVIRGISA